MPDRVMMRPWLLAGLLTATLTVAPHAGAQRINALNQIGEDFDARGRVVELDFPEDMDGRRFIVAWVVEDGEKDGVWRVARGGRHCYDMRHLAGWKGRIRRAAITVSGIPGRVKAPAWQDEIDMFWEPERLAPSTVNSLIGHSLLSLSWNAVLLILAGAPALLLWRLRRLPATVALALGFVISWGVMDLRAAYDRFVIVSGVEAHRGDMPPLASVKAFSDRAAGIIGAETWSSEPLSGVFNSFVRYRLAEHPYIPLDSPARAAFLITQNPTSGQVIWQNAGYFLVKKGQP